MEQSIIKQCSKCGQQLRFPKNIGGMLMACPTCGQKFQSDFRFKDAPGTPIIRIYNQGSDACISVFRYLSNLCTSFLSKK